MVSVTQTQMFPEPQAAATAAAAEASQPASVLGLLRDFSKQAGCEAYAADGEKIRLLNEYLWIRQLTPDLPFEAFLRLYAPLADYDETNLKRPEDAVKHLCPRNKGQAEKAGLPQWKANQVVDILALYVDVVRYSELAREPVPMTLSQFLQTQSPAYLAGEIAPAPPPPAVRSAGAKKRQAAPGEPQPADPETGLVPSGNPLRPTADGQRVIYAVPYQGGRQVKGVARRVWSEEGRTYVDFESDAGEQMPGCAITDFVVADETPPQPPPPREQKRLTLTKTQWNQAQAALGLQTPMGNVKLGDPVYSFSCVFASGVVADLQVINGEQGPFVDAELLSGGALQNQVLCSLEPRKHLLGEYRFETAEGDYVLEVDARE